MLNHYEGWSEAELLILRKSLQGQSVNGQVLRTSIAGVSVEKAPFATSGGSRVTTLKRVQYALWLIGETQVADTASGITVNPYQNPWTSTIKRTRVNYTDY
ncbi:MAG: hypothetical protein PHQ12_11405 [Chthoniobacteraceae bacterium]|nr:hypothetical protein [Chthoniobacteraceae bacterium]